MKKSDDILKLGKKICEELNLEEGVDTLGRWMSHYVAELIQSAEESASSQVKEKCFQTILTLWSHRSVFPSSLKPLADFEPILRALESLDPERSPPRKFSVLMNDETWAAAEPIGADNWLTTALEIDYGTTTLINYCLARASLEAKELNSDWIDFLQGLELEEVMEISIMTRLSTDSEAIFSKDPRKIETQKTQKVLKRLDEFIALAEKFSGELKQKIGELERR